MILGIDPGKTGGLALFDGEEIVLTPMFRTADGGLDEAALAKWVYKHSNSIEAAFLEEPFAMRKSSAVSMLNFGISCGVVRGILVANFVKVVDVKPQAWQKVVHVGLPKTLDAKERSALAFKRIFPNVDAKLKANSKRDDLGLVDAALIAHYGYHQTYPF